MIIYFFAPHCSIALHLSSLEWGVYSNVPQISQIYTDFFVASNGSHYASQQ